MPSHTPAERAKKRKRPLRAIAERIEKKGTKGALRRQLDVPEGMNIPGSWIRKISEAKIGETVSLPKVGELEGKKMRVTLLLKKRAITAQIFQKARA